MVADAHAGNRSCSSLQGTGVHVVSSPRRTAPATAEEQASQSTQMFPTTCWLAEHVSLRHAPLNHPQSCAELTCAQCHSRVYSAHSRLTSLRPGVVGFPHPSPRQLTAHPTPVQSLPHSGPIQPEAQPAPVHSLPQLLPMHSLAQLSPVHLPPHRVSWHSSAQLWPVQYDPHMLPVHSAAHRVPPHFSPH